MTEFNKIIRYLIPVFIYFGYTFVFISLWLLPKIYFYEILANSKIEISLIIPFAAGIGFVISAIHHYCFWNVPFYPKTKYRNFIKNLEQSGLLKFVKQNKYSAIERKGLLSVIKQFFREPKVLKRKYRKLNEEDYWRIINILWHRLREDDLSFEKINSRNDSLTDLMHGNGSSLISLILAGITSCFYIAYCYLEFNVLATELYNKYTLVFFFLFFVLFLLHSKSYKFTTENLNKFVQDALFHSLSLKKKKDLPVKFYLGNF